MKAVIMQKDEMNGLLNAAVEETFKTTLGISPENIPSNFFNDNIEECVISSIGFIGTLEGTCTICLPDSSACNLISLMLSQRVSEINADTVDGIGEVINIILGNIKMRLQGSKFDFNISVPSYIKGSRMVVLTDIKKNISIKSAYKLNDIIFVISLMYKIQEKENISAKKRFAFAKLKTITEI